MEVYLVIDQGNTRTKAGVFKAGKLFKALVVRRLTVAVCRNWIKKYTPNAVLVSSVGRLPVGVKKMIAAKSTLVQLSHTTRLPIKNRYKSPETLGSDRIACAVGGHARFPESNVLVIDAGTCIKYDFIDSKGNYHGGSISPGIAMRLNALAHFTEKLPKIKPAPIKSFIGNDTESSILTGVMQGTANEMEGFVSRYRQKFGKLNIILTGGDGERLSELLKLSIFAAPDLVLEGLYEILQHERKSR